MTFDYVGGSWNIPCSLHLPSNCWFAYRLRNSDSEESEYQYCASSLLMTLTKLFHEKCLRVISSLLSVNSSDHSGRILSRSYVVLRIASISRRLELSIVFSLSCWTRRRTGWVLREQYRRRTSARAWWKSWKYIKGHVFVIHRINFPFLCRGDFWFNDPHICVSVFFEELT